MAVRTISRDANNSRAVCVWPKGIDVDDVSVGQNDAMYARNDDGGLVQPALIPTDVFKAAFGFIPNTGAVASYTLVKTVNKVDLADKLAKAIMGLLSD